MIGGGNIGSFIEGSLLGGLSGAAIGGIMGGLAYALNGSEVAPTQTAEQNTQKLDSALTLTEGESSAPNISGSLLSAKPNQEGQLVAWNMVREYGTTANGLSENISRIETVVDEVSNNVAGRDATVTYTTNGTHSPNLAHYSGNAVDLRIRDLTPGQINQMTNGLRQRLGTEYRVIRESDHIHIQYQRR